PIDAASRRAGAAGLDIDAVAAVVGHEGIGDDEAARGGGRQVADHCNAVTSVVADDTVLDGQGQAAVVANSIAAAEADPLDGQPAQADPVRTAGIDGDSDETPGNQHTGLADAVVDDADALRDGDGAVAARVEHGNFAERQRLVVRPLEGPAGRETAAVVGVVAE